MEMNGKTLYTHSTKAEVPVDVDFHVWKGYPASYWEPGMEDEAEIIAVRVNGINIMDEIADDILAELSQECLEWKPDEDGL